MPCLYREADAVGDTCNSKLLSSGVTCASKGLAECNSDTNVMAAGTATGTKAGMDLSPLQLLVIHKSLLSFSLVLEEVRKVRGI